MSHWISDYLLYVNFFIIWFFLVVNLAYVFLLTVSVPDIFMRFQEIKKHNLDLFLHSKFLPPVTALVPAYNEEENIVNTVSSLLRSTYSNLQIVVVSDGSTDRTFDLINENFQLVPIYPVVAKKIPTVGAVKQYYQSKLHPHLIFIDKEHSGKSDSMNVGLNYCNTPLFMSIDGDTLLEAHTVSILVFSMLSYPHTIAEGGSIYILNGCKYKDGELLEQRMSYSIIEAMQSCEYLRAFLFGRTGWKLFYGPIVLAGALTMLEREAVLEIGGYNLDAPGEDMEIIVALHEYMRTKGYPYRVGYSFSAAGWSHCPTNMIALWSQRARWHRGLMDSLLRHKKMFFNYKFGVTGMISFPFQFIVEFLGPIVEFTGYVAVTLSMYFNVINWKVAILFFIATAGFAGILTMITTLISIVSFDKYKRTIDIVYQLFLSVFENLGYRQLLGLCRVVTTIRFIIVRLFSSRTGHENKNW